ncbi:putative AatA outermembrane domain protein, partial [Escherichia coli P0301867.8]
MTILYCLNSLFLLGNPHIINQVLNLLNIAMQAFIFLCL